MIRLSTEQDIVPLKKLMKAVFGDTNRFINLFFKYHYQNNALVYEEKQDIIAMAFLLPATLLVEEKHLPITYVYACATKESHRGKGIMKQILAFAYTISKEKKEAGLCLLPASESLYIYYGELGFKTFFYSGSKEYKRKKKLSGNISSSYSFQKITPQKYTQLRKSALDIPYSVHWEKNHFQIIKSGYGDNGAFFFTISEDQSVLGIAVAYQVNNEVYVMEVIGKPIKTDLLASSLFNLYDNADRIKINTTSPQEKAGMILSTLPDIQFTEKKGYLNFCLD